MRLGLKEQHGEEDQAVVRWWDEAPPVLELRVPSTRLSWMRRYGMLEYDEQRKMWRVSDGGQRVTEAKLRAAAARQLVELPDESRPRNRQSVRSVRRACRSARTRGGA